MKKTLALFAALLAFLPAFSQEPELITNPEVVEDDILLRTGAEVEYYVLPSLYLALDQELRFKENVSTFDRSYTTLSTTYKVNPYFKVGAAYRFMAINHDGKKSTGFEKYWDIRNRAYLSFIGQAHLGRWKVSLRERPIATWRTGEFNPKEKVNPELELRSKAEVSYKFFSKPLMPYISYELCNTLNHSPYISGNYICGNRYEAGLKWRLTQELALDFFYRYDVGRNYDIDINKKETKVEMTPESSSIHNFGVYLDVAFK